MLSNVSNKMSRFKPLLRPTLCARLELNLTKCPANTIHSSTHRLPAYFTSQEVRACHRLLRRSGIESVIHWERMSGLRCLHWDRISGVRGLQTSAALGQPDGGKGNKDGRDDDERKVFLVGTMVGFFLVPIVLLTLFGTTPPGRDEPTNPNNPDAFREPPKQVTWNDFYYNMLLVGEVQDIIIRSGVNRATVILHPDAIYKGHRVNNNVFRLAIPNAENLEDKIREAEAKLGISAGDGVSVTYERKSEDVARVISFGIIIAVLGLLFMGGRNVRAQMGGMSGGMDPFNRLTKADFTLVDPQIKTGKGVKFDDVAGLKEAKIEVKEFVDYLKHPERYIELGAKPPKGAILFGPPGCGKTMLAKAVANESGVPFLSMNGSEFIEMIGGLGAARVRSLFAEARKRQPSIIYIDEIDAIGRQRSAGSGAGTGGGTGEMEQTLNQLLVEMDGISSKSGVIMLASTNRSEVLDKALLRPGRFDRHITIDLPSVSERKEIIEQHMKGVVLQGSSTDYSERMATLTPGFSGADLANLVNEAALHAARVKSSKVGLHDFEYAIERVIAGPEKKTGVLNATERTVIAYHEAGHALVGWKLEHTDALLKVTIIPRTSNALGFAQYTPVDKKLFTPDDIDDRMCMALGGRVAESLTFNRVTTGAQDDLDKVTKMAYSQVKHYGFSPIVGNLSFEETGGRWPYSKQLKATIDGESQKLIGKAYKRTEALLQQHQDELKLLAEALLEKETLNYDDVEKLLGPPPYGKKHLVSPVDYERQLKEQSVMGENLKTD